MLIKWSSIRLSILRRRGHAEGRPEIAADMVDPFMPNIRAKAEECNVTNRLKSSPYSKCNSILN
jgi:hypothetical protein